MTPERIAELVARWVRLYTRGLHTRIAERRVAEVDADLHDHIAHERAGGISERRIALDIASRLVRGVAADIAWRSHSTREGAMKTNPNLNRSAARVTVGVASILSLPLVAMLFTDEVSWSAADFVLAGLLLTVLGIALELTVNRAGNVAATIGIAAVGVAAAVFGEADDAPGLVLLGILLIAAACAIGVRRAQHGS